MLKYSTGKQNFVFVVDQNRHIKFIITLSSCDKFYIVIHKNVIENHIFYSVGR
jgi:hypothetical protein